MQQRPNRSPATAQDQVAEQLRRMWEKNWSNQDFSPSWTIAEIPHLIQQAVNKEWFPPGARLLDIGCGDGEITAWLARQNYSVLGVDLAPSAIQRAKDSFGEVPDKLEFRVSDICREPFATPEFDALLDRGCLQGLPKSFYEQYAKTIAICARPAARFLLISGINMDISQKMTPHQEKKLFDEMCQRLEALFQPAFEIIKMEKACIERPSVDISSPGLAAWMIRRTDDSTP